VSPQAGSCARANMPSVVSAVANERTVLSSCADYKWGRKMLLPLAGASRFPRLLAQPIEFHTSSLRRAFRYWIYKVDDG